MSNKKSNGINLGIGSWLFVQCALFVVHYGFNKTLPIWVLWFPSIVCGSMIVAALIGAGLMLLLSWIIDKIKQRGRRRWQKEKFPFL